MTKRQYLELIEQVIWDIVLPFELIVIDDLCGLSHFSETSPKLALFIRVWCVHLFDTKHGDCRNIYADDVE